jgi:hypothetical protein
MSVVSEPESSSTVPGTVLPGTVFTPRQVRILKIAVIVMGVLLVGGFAFVLAAIVYQASHPAQDATLTGAQAVPGEGALSIDLPVPAGAAVTAMSLDGNRLAVHLAAPSGPEIAVIDLATGEIVAHVRLKPQ